MEIINFKIVKFIMASIFIILFICLFVLPVQGQVFEDTGFNFSGDFRLRYENTEDKIQARSLFQGRNRAVVRFRAGISKKINEYISFGTRLATGSGDDPNTTDATLGTFVNDLEISLDRAFIEFNYKDLFLTGGKFANPFARTDLVWDSDVNPQGFAGSYNIPFIENVNPTIRGVYSIIDEQPLTLDSYMLGSQLELNIYASQDFKFILAGAFYNYTIQSLSNAGDGDTRSNNLIFDTTGTAISYMSDFDLFDMIAIIRYDGFGASVPVYFVVDYVKNLGAEVDEDQGFMLDLFVGKTTNVNDTRFRYGYAEVEKDAILAAFSNDNTTIATNYIQHTFTLDYVVLDNTTLNLTWYLYKNKMALPGVKNDLISRLRLNTVIKF